MSIYKSEQNIHSSFIVILKKWKPKYPSTDEQINGYVHTVEYHLTIKKEQTLETCNNLDDSPDNYLISKGQVLDD